MAKTRAPYFKFKKKEDDQWEALSIKLPKFTWDTLRDLATERQIPLGRLVGIAVDNELVKENAFEQDLGFPEIIHVPNAYAEEASRIEKLLVKFPGGIGLDALILFRWSIGIPSRESFMLGYRELFLAKRIEHRPAKRPLPAFQYKEDYELIFLSEPPSRRMSPKDRREKDLLAIENAELRRQLNLLKGQTK